MLAQSSAPGAMLAVHLLLPAVLALDFDVYVAQFKKAYRDDEVDARRAVYRANLELIQKHNARPEHSWRMGVNQFTDMTDEEFSSNILTLFVLQVRTDFSDS